MPSNVTAVEETFDSNVTMISDIVDSSKGNGGTSDQGLGNTDHTSTEDHDDHKDHGNLILIDIVVPLVITALIVVLLCLAVLYTKARRKRNAQAGRNTEHLPSISGGVPLNAAVYQNYNEQVVMRDRSHRATGRPDSGVSWSSDSVSMYVDRPPSYEDVIKETHSRASTLGSQGTLVSDSGSYNMIIAPPPYSPGPNQSSAPRSRDTHTPGATLSATSDTLTADSGISSRAQSHQSGTFTEVPLTDPASSSRHVQPSVTASESALTSRKYDNKRQRSVDSGRGVNLSPVHGVAPHSSSLPAHSALR